MLRHGTRFLLDLLGAFIPPAAVVGRTRRARVIRERPTALA